MKFNRTSLTAIGVLPVNLFAAKGHMRLYLSRIVQGDPKNPVPQTHCTAAQLSCAQDCCGSCLTTLERVVRGPTFRAVQNFLRSSTTTGGKANGSYDI